MTKTANSSIPASKNAKDFPELSSFYREIGIAAVAAAVRYQRVPASDDNKTKEYVSDKSRTTPIVEALQFG